MKLVGGRNGYGAKLCNIYSKKFVVETVSKEQNLKFCQSWYDNMSRCDEPRVEKTDKTDYTMISFKPDTERFQKFEFDRIIKLIEKRTVDVAGTLMDVNVYFNDKKIEIETFFDYANLYDSNLTSFNISKRWKVSLGLSDNGFQQISFVNNIHTPLGGRHVDYIVDQVVSSLKSAIEESLNGQTIRPSIIKSKLFVLVNATIQNPSFDSQCKDSLNTRVKDFGSTAVLNKQEILEWAEQSGLLDLIANELQRKKQSKSRDRMSEIIPKLEEANLAGTERSSECTLIITEGDSAKALAVAGLEIVGRDKYGVFPIRGKLTNVSDVKGAVAFQNKEISSLMKIIGLEFNKDFSVPQNKQELRYGRCMILADQDEDGSHIKGLLLNFFFTYWPSLIKSGFICSLRTPLIKAKKGVEIKEFYSTADYLQWVSNDEDSSKYSVKYYKGLGTSTSVEARDYFRAIDQNTVVFTCNQEVDEESLHMAFDRNRAQSRKNWLAQKTAISPDLGSDGRLRSDLSLSSFVNEELIEFSLLDLKRSIPSVIDGLKPSQRKVLHTLLQNNDGKEIKVNRLASAVALKQVYHHGEESLVNTIIRMAQFFPGSNNLPLLQAIGQFGTRHEGGEDSASGRYIHTKLSSFTRLLFPSVDDDLLSYQVEENQNIEPIWYCPILPLVLVNGAEGIATGWATRVLNHSLNDIIDNTKRMIEKRAVDDMLPYWENYGGTVDKIDHNRYSIKGKLSVIDRKNGIASIEISELPVGVWTSKYKEKVLVPLYNDGSLREIMEYHTEACVKFIVKLSRELSSRTTKELSSLFKMSTVLSTNSMVLFDENNSLQRYDSTIEIMNAFYPVRKELYMKRLKHLTQLVNAQKVYYENQLKFIDYSIKGKLNLSLSKVDMEACLLENGFNINPLSSVKNDVGNFCYLLDMPLSKLSIDEFQKLLEKYDKKKTEYETVVEATWRNEWFKDLEAFQKVLKSS